MKHNDDCNDGKRFSTRVLDESLAETRKRGERKRLDLLARVFAALEGLSRKIAFHDAYVFGSLCREGDFKKGSDVDIGFIGLKSEDVVSATAYLSGELSIDVDVVQLEDYRCARKVMREGIPWKKIN